MLKMANKVVKVSYNELENIVSILKLLNEDLESYIDPQLNKIVNDTEAWDSKFQRAFDKHITEITSIQIKKILQDTNKYTNYLEKTIKNYQKIDEYR